MPETPRGNIDTFVEGLKNAERKPTSKTPFVATITDSDGNKVRRTLNTVSYHGNDEDQLKVNDDILHEAGTGVRHPRAYFVVLLLRIYLCFWPNAYRAARWPYLHCPWKTGTASKPKT